MLIVRCSRSVHVVIGGRISRRRHKRCVVIVLVARLEQASRGRFHHHRARLCSFSLLLLQFPLDRRLNSARRGLDLCVSTGGRLHLLMGLPWAAYWEPQVFFVDLNPAADLAIFIVVVLGGAFSDPHSSSSGGQVSGLRRCCRE